MATMKFMTFTFPEDPEEFRIMAQRQPQYTVGSDGLISYQGLGPMCRVISGSGVFRGSTAVDRFNSLSVIMAAGRAGDLIHPTWGTMTAYLTELEMKQVHHPGEIAYQFTFREADESGAIPALPGTVA